jgi:putative endonuclease
MARCRDGTLYTGIARDVVARLAQHDAGKGARYTRGRGPLTLAAVAAFRTHGNALSVELAVKALPRAAKEALVAAAGHPQAGSARTVGKTALTRFARKVVARRRARLATPPRPR